MAVATCIEMQNKQRAFSLRTTGGIGQISERARAPETGGNFPFSPGRNIFGGCGLILFSLELSIFQVFHSLHHYLTV